jgi:hypothetical protein
VSARLSALLAAALGTLLLAAGCGHSASQRPEVAQYIRRVNRIETQLAQPLAAVTRAGARFAAAPGAAAGNLGGILSLGQEKALVSAIGRVRALRGRLASIPAPAPAARLRTLLLRLIDAQVSVTRQVASLAAFLPRFQRALGPLAPATARLEASLSQNSAYGATAVAELYAAKVAALRRFQTQVKGVASQLRRLNPPAVSKPSYTAQLASLDGMASSAGKLAGALASGQRSGLEPLLTRFDRAATSAQSATVQRAETAAVKAYDARITGLGELSRSVEKERTRLADSLR